MRTLGRFIKYHYDPKPDNIPFWAILLVLAALAAIGWLSMPKRFTTAQDSYITNNLKK